MYCVLEGKRSLRGDRYWGMYNVLCIEGALNFSYPSIHNTLHIPQYLSPLKLLLPFNTQYIVHVVEGKRSLRRDRY
jgi:hypothetical protein